MTPDYSESMLEAAKALADCHTQLVDKKDYASALVCTDRLMKAALNLSVDIELRLQGVRK
jgi:hypothetical protein